MGIIAILPSILTAAATIVTSLYRSDKPIETEVVNEKSPVDVGPSDDARIDELQQFHRENWPR